MVWKSDFNNPSLEVSCQYHKFIKISCILRVTKLLKLMNILHIRYGYHKFTQGIGPMSNLLTAKEVNYESVKSIKNLVGLSPNQFEKKILTAVIRKILTAVIRW
jgi:hypothetical protein